MTYTFKVDTDVGVCDDVGALSLTFGSNGAQHRQVKCIETISEEYWNAICSEQVLDEGRSLSVVGSSKQALQKDKKAVIQEWRKSILFVFITNDRSDLLKFRQWLTRH